MYKDSGINTMGRVKGKDLGLNFFLNESFFLFHPRVYGANESKVYLNKSGDFAVIFPIPAMDYDNYNGRAKQLGLKTSTKQKSYLMERLKYLEKSFNNRSWEHIKILEVGANEGDFLNLIKEKYKNTFLMGVDPCANLGQYKKIKGIKLYRKVEDIPEYKFDVICMFHTFEHFIDPISELSKLKKLLTPQGFFVIEIPSLFDPLNCLYQISEFRDFYFQKQHPYVYTASSIRRLLETYNCKVISVNYFQRYGISNHLHWLKELKPGDNNKLKNIFKDVDLSYKKALEKNKLSDTLFIKFQF